MNNPVICRLVRDIYLRVLRRVGEGAPYNYPRVYPLTSRAAAAVMLNQLKVTAMSYRHPRTTPVATAVQIRRAEEGSPGGFTVGGGAGTIEWVGGGVGDPPPRVLYKIPLMAHLLPRITYVDGIC